MKLGPNAELQERQLTHEHHKKMSPCFHIASKAAARGSSTGWFRKNTILLKLVAGAPGTIRTSDPQIRRPEQLGQLSAHVGQLLVRDQALTRHHRQRRSIKDDDRTVLKSVLLEH
jgi:hypothetical protein